MTPGGETRQRLGEAADADDAAREHVLQQPADGPGDHAGDRLPAQRDVDDADEHEVERPAAADRIAGERHLQDHGDEHGGDDGGQLH